MASPGDSNEPDVDMAPITTGLPGAFLRRYFRPFRQCHGAHGHECYGTARGARVDTGAVLSLAGEGLRFTTENDELWLTTWFVTWVTVTYD